MPRVVLWFVSQERSQLRTLGEMPTQVTGGLNAVPALPSEGVYAHSLQGEPVDRWESLSHHLAAVGTRAAEFAAQFGCTEAARVSGNLHDIGKLSPEFQAYIRGQRATGGDHSSAGARVAYDAYPHP